ncbi:GTP-binding protein [Pseudoflavonifractor phocaeensis]|uniref:TIGR03943 family putative permease subunit n=1 Tax=Pseudoflavonifractor phocaeensis TaxID=1870988 RepID=UPI001F32FC64|nr:GTP-binding protein [Pseudoflavonifractor phocaeensis]MCF2661381.1 GTPase [Pseudoflavonifractor phocaeensis]
MKDSRIPLYLITGFLDSGKTTLLTDTLNMDYFNDGQRTVLLMCEDGETEYDQQQLSHRNCRLIPVESQEQLNTAFLQEIDRRYQPERVLVEYNGMWPIQILRDLKLPKTWGLYQAIDVIDGTTFEMYRNNMQSMIIDMVTEADMVLFNRCTSDMPMSGWKRSIRAANRMCEIVFEDDKGEELEVEDILPYSLEDPHITLEDPDYGIWYLDIQEHPERYVGKTITYKAQAMTGMRLPKGSFVPGRNAMTCCAEDIRFFGFLCKYDRARSLKKGEWITVTAEIKWEDASVYDGEGVVLYAQSVEKAQRPEDPLVYFR